jgi:uncharacterized protein YdeI (YjbR/CyaY-like superfamily)
MPDKLYIQFKNRKEWRIWLQKNHFKYNEVWLIYYKAKTPVTNISYDDSVEEALCFGWIDSIIKNIDQSKYARKFTPRTNTKKWSALNLKRVKKAIDEGLMNKAGYDKIDSTVYKNILKTNNTNSDRRSGHAEFIVPGYITDFFKKNEPALQNFNKLATSYKKQYVLWITNAKREETINKRMIESASLLKENKKLGLK